MISPCTRSHIPEVVELMGGRAARGDQTRHAKMCRYLEEIYLDNPWFDPDMPSLVSTDSSDRVEGFLGVTPRPMILYGERIRMASTSNLYVRGAEDGRAQNPLAAFRLLKALFEGPQDLSVASGANRLTKKLWEACGGVAVPLYSLNWFRPLKPLRGLLELGRDDSPLYRILRPVADAMDLLGGKGILRQMTGRGAAYTVGELDVQFVLNAIARTPGFNLRPHYDASSFAWLLEMSRRLAVDGRLRAGALRDASERTVGWFVYVQTRKRVAEVLQLVASDGELAPALRAVIRHATSEGMALLRGEADPRDLPSYRESLCLLTTTRWMLVHARRPDVLASFMQGKVLFTGLDGEKWVPFLPHVWTRQRWPIG